MKRSQTKEWWRISVEMHPTAEDAVAELLERELRCTPVTTHNFESGRTIVAVYLADRPERRALQARLQEQVKALAKFGLPIGSVRIAIEKVAPEDWRHSWKRHFKPLEVGRALLIRPSWSQRRARRGQRVVVLDPGLSFGTGQHATTRYCLQAIVAPWKSGEPHSSLLDIGTGTGILAIAAAKLGYSNVEAFDNDPVAVRVAKQNARRNRVSCSIDQMDVGCLTMQPRHRFDVVCANLIDTLLIEHARRIASRLRAGGRLVLAGVLNRQFAAVAKAYAIRGLRVVARDVTDGWTSATFSGVTEV